MNILMIGNTASIGWNLKKGLELLGCHCDILFKKNICISGQSTKKNNILKKYDIIHVHSPSIFKLRDYGKYISTAKHVLCHWHGSNLRQPIKQLTFMHYWNRKADYHLYSTVDLSYYLKKINKNKKQMFLSPVDTKLFKSNKNKKHTTLILSGGAKTDNPILHDDMPDYLNDFASLQVCPSNGLSEKLLQVSMLEGASCGLDVLNHSWLNRDWVIKYASIESQSQKILEIYNKVLKS